ncbi:MAG: hypothetical protein AAB569_03530 [Patescibacteria group bacterium]
MNNLVKNQIKTMVEESVEEIFRREMRKLHASLLPYVSENEQRDIEKRFGRPSRRYVRSFAL